MGAMRTRLVAAAAVVAAAVGAGAFALWHRGSGGGGTDWLAGNGRPVQLQLAFEPERGRAKEITPKGGTISVVAGDGTRFELRIPEGALTYPERISVIPIASVRGLPLQGGGGSIAAVHLKPEGLRLMKPATLSIRPRAEVPVAEQVAFAYTGNGRDAYLYPMALDPRRIELPILHFSGYGFGQAPPDDPGRKALQAATDKEARLQSQVAEIIAEERARLQLGRDEGPTLYELNQRIEPLAIQYYKEVLRPLLRTAETDERMAPCATERFLSWVRQLELLGMLSDDDEEPASDTKLQELDALNREGWASLEKIRDNYYKKTTERAIKQCKEEHDFDAIGVLVAIEREAQVMGGTNKYVSDLWKALADCLSFEVEFRSVIERKTPTGGTYYHVLAKVPLTAVPGFEEPASGPLEYVAFRASGNPLRDLNQGKAVKGNDFFSALIAPDADGTISPAGTQAGTFRLLGLHSSRSKKKFMQTNCSGRDEEQERETVDSMAVAFFIDPPVEKVRFVPTRAGRTSMLGEAVASFPEALGNKAMANEVRNQARVGGAFVMEERGWADAFARFHHDDAVSWPGAPTTDDEEGGGMFALNLRPVTPGVWRADLKSETPSTPTLSGFSVSESGYIIVRHTPK
jgi:hypothetical protein